MVKQKKKKRFFRLFKFTLDIKKTKQTKQIFSANFKYVNTITN